MKVINTLTELLSCYDIEIPMLQRDYAQGRKDKHSSSVRENLLEDIKTSLEDGNILDLNFIYGKTENGKFIPLDGQQRLTTLFLVHLYAFANDESKTELLKKFTYETRRSSRSFFEKLVDHRAAVFASDTMPAEEISDSDWYQADWDNDPTVESVKTVLNDIVRILGGIDGIDEKLTNQETEPIRFSFLPMDELGMEDSIYIKLNARGRMLTPFENYKAQLISRVQRLWEDKELYIEPHIFERQLDCIWTDFFWSTYRGNFDAAFKGFFDVLFTNYASIVENGGYVSTVEAKDVTAQMIEAAYYTLNYLSSNDRKDEVWSFISDCLRGQPSFTQRILFFAVSEYMLQAKGNVQQSLDQWVRIIRNIINNTSEDVLGRADRFGTALQAIEELSSHWNDLLNYFANETVSLKSFSPLQIEEERIKAKLISRSSDFAAKILLAEDHGYFVGQLRSALSLAGINYNAAKNDDNLSLEEKMLTFDAYWSKISALFNNNGPVYGILMRQALLSYQDYTLATGSYHSFGVDNPSDPVSLKALFADESKKQLIRTLLDSFPTAQANDIKISLMQTVSNTNLLESDWRYCFIRYPELFVNMSKQYMRIYKGSKTLIVKNKATNGYNYEVFTSALNQILISKNKKRVYYWSMGSFGDNYVRTKVNGETVDIRFLNGKFVVCRKDGDVNKQGAIIFETQNNPLSSIVSYLDNNP